MESPSIYTSISGSICHFAKSLLALCVRNVIVYLVTVIIDVCGQNKY